MIKSKILFISSRPIYPIIGGDQIRTAQQLELLAERYEVHVVYLSNDRDENIKQALYPSEVKVTPFFVAKWKHIFYTLRAFLNGKPLQVNYYFHKRLQLYIDEHIHEYEAIFCNNIRTAEYACHRKGVKKYLDFVDAISMNYEKAKQNASGLEKLIYSIDFHRCRKYEQFVLEKFDSCAIISPIDQKYILSCQRSM